jgi:hypothetical protein
MSTTEHRRTRVPGLIDARALPFFTPLSISGCELWLRADTISGLNDNDAVGTWSDESGNSNNFAQATAGNKPVYKTGILNSLPVVRFDGSDDYIQCTGMTGTSINTFLFVIDPAGTSPGGIFDTAPNAQNTFRNYNTGQFEWWNGDPVFNLSLANHNPMILTFTTTNSPTRSVVYYRDGTLVSTNNSGGTAAMAWGNPVIGTVNLSLVPYNGDIAEVLIYSAILGTTDFLNVIRYLGNKWGITTA